MTMTRLLQCSDLHIGPEPASAYKGVTTRASFSAVLEHMRRHSWPADALLLTGDLAADAEPAAYAWLVDTLGALPLPVYCLPGNHDDPATMRRWLRAGNVAMPESFVLGAWRVVCLDSTVPGASPGCLSETRVARLTAELSTHATAPTMIALHHHPLPSESAWLDVLNLTNADALFTAIAGRPQVRGIVWGHVHQVMDAMRDGVHLLGCPATCIQFKPRQSEFTLDDLPPAYRWLDLHDDGTIETGIEWLSDS